MKAEVSFLYIIKVRNIFKQRIAVTTSDKNFYLLFRVINFNSKMKITRLVNEAPT